MVVFVRVRLFQSPQTSDVVWSHAWWRPLCGFSTKPILLFQTTSTQTALCDEVTVFTAKQWSEHSRNVGSETEVTVAWGWMKEEAAENHLPPSLTQLTKTKPRERPACDRAVTSLKKPKTIYTRLGVFRAQKLPLLSFTLMNIFISPVYLRIRPTENQPCLPNEKKTICFWNLRLRGRLCFTLSGTLVKGAGKHVLAKTAACLFACWLENEKAHSHICTSLNGRLLLLTYGTRMSAGRWRKRMNWTKKNPSDTSPKVSYERFPAFFWSL